MNFRDRGITKYENTRLLHVMKYVITDLVFFKSVAVHEIRKTVTCVGKLHTRVGNILNVKRAPTVDYLKMHNTCEIFDS